MSKTLRFFGPVVMVVLLAGTARADQSMRCDGGRLASVGDHAYEVRGVCGEPDRADRRVVVRTLAVAERRLASVVTVEVIVDEWVYDLGPDRFLRILTFENGRLVRITTRGRGRR